jgi:proteasome lid subunit RPN8/RPN11
MINIGATVSVRQGDHSNGPYPRHRDRTVIEIPRSVHDEIVAAAIDSYPYEACGLIAGVPDGGAGVAIFYPCTNIAASARVYTIDPKDHLRAELDADERGLEIIGVVHSHTHSPAYPSPTDVAAAPDPSWHYVIVSLEHGEPDTRSYRIVDGQITDEPVVVA